MVSTLRVATEDDLPALRRLIDFAVIPPPTAAPDPDETRYLLVLDAPGGGLAAAVIVSLNPPVARLEALAMEPCHATFELEARLIGVVEALAEAFGCTPLEIARRAA